MQQVYHVPVMLSECMDALAIQANGVYVDVTFGGGGHSRAILSQLGEKGKLFAFDQDPDALANAIDDSRFTLIHQNFQFLKNSLRFHGVTQVDGIIADLGISSHQIDDASRGFSIRFNAELDMRMDQSRELDAKKVLNEYSEEELHRILGMYGELKNAKTVANVISSARYNEPFVTVDDVKKILMPYAPKGRDNKFFAQLFQALRVEVNKEMEALEEFLLQSVQVLKPGGRLVVMSYHSLEDRLVKNFINKGKFKGEVEKDFYGNEIKPLKNISRKAIMASEEEILKNSRARSAKLRVAEKI